MPELIDEMLALAQLHFTTLNIAFVIEAKDVKNAMHDEQRNLIIKRSGVGRCLEVGDLRTNDAISKQTRDIVTFPSIDIERKRQHIGWVLAYIIEMLNFQINDVGSIHKGERKLTRLSLGAQNGLCKTPPPIKIDVYNVLGVFGDDNRMRLAAVGGT